MSRRRVVPIVMITAACSIALAVTVLAPDALAGRGTTEYKFVRMVDDGAMPAITAALNREAERGWELDEMAVIPGDPGTIYLVFKK